MADKNDKNKAAPETAPKNKMPLIAIFAAVLLVAMAATFIIGKQVSAKSKSNAPKPIEHGPILALDEFLVNLADPSGDHFLKVTVSLELNKASGKTPDALKDQVPIVRDAVLMSLSTKSRDDVSSLSGREKLKVEIKKAVNTALGENDIQDVYFTNFVTQ
jgi:flagellar FliL protein